MNASQRRRPSSIPRVEWKVSLPAETAARIEMRLYAPHSKKPDYGARSRLIDTLLLEYIRDTDDGKREPIL